MLLFPEGALDHDYKRPEYLEDRISSQKTKMKDQCETQKPKTSVRQPRKESKQKDDKNLQKTSVGSEYFKNKEKKEDEKTSSSSEYFKDKYVV